MKALTFLATEALELGNGLVKILPTTDYDPEDEAWEFPAESIVPIKRVDDPAGAYLLAVSQFS